MPADTPRTEPRWYAAWVLAVLFLVGGFNAIDRLIVGVLMEPIKHDIHASDGAMGFLVGIAFTLFYATFGIPIARWCDTGSRRTILAIGVALWSGMMVVFAMAQTFAQLAITRVGVAVGEATQVPASLSLIADYFPERQRPVAVGILRASFSVFAIGGVIVVAVIAQHFGWRAAVLAVGLPGLPLALLVRMTVREPERGRYDDEGANARGARNIWGSLRELAGRRDYRLLVAAMGAHGVLMLSGGAWFNPFLQRVHHLTLVQAAGVASSTIATASVIGTLGGGFLWGYLRRRGWREQQLPVMAGCALLLDIPCLVGFLFMPTLVPALPCLFLQQLFGWVVDAPLQALILSRLPSHSRALGMALVLIAFSVVGGGLGPLAVGILSDRLHGVLGSQSLRYALLIATATEVIAATLLFRAARAIGAEPVDESVRPIVQPVLA